MNGVNRITPILQKKFLAFRKRCDCLTAVGSCGSDLRTFAKSRVSIGENPPEIAGEK
jgi:hypothetical protein